MTKKLFHTIIIATLTFALADCGNRRLPPVNSKSPDNKGLLTLYVSNQSLIISPVDIQVKIDDKVVVDEYFHVGKRCQRQHNWKGFQMNLANGRHRLHVSSRKGKAELTKEFEVKGKHSAAISYVYYRPKLDYEPPPKHFDFVIQDKPIIFQ